jgi:hypothetical protein
MGENEMDSNNMGAIIRVNDQGHIIRIDVIANSDKKANRVQQSLERISRPSAWSKLKRLLPGGYA